MGLLVCLTGCASMGGGGRTTAAAPTVGEPFETVRISYRADSARLTTLATPHGGQPVGYTDGGIPPGTLGTLEVRYPHPRHGPEWAQVVATYEAGPDTPATALESTSIIKRMWGKTKDELPGLKGSYWTHERRTLDVPKWQLDRIVTQVRGSGFFRAAHVPSPEIFMAAQVDGMGSRKNWDSFPELDALLLRARVEGQLVSQTLPPGSPSQPAASAAPSAPQVAGGSGYFDALARPAGAASAGDGWAVGNAGDAAAAADSRVVRLPDVR